MKQEEKELFNKNRAMLGEGLKLLEDAIEKQKSLIGHLKSLILQIK